MRVIGSIHTMFLISVIALFLSQQFITIDLVLNIGDTRKQFYEVADHVMADI